MRAILIGAEKQALIASGFLLANQIREIAKWSKASIFISYFTQMKAESILGCSPATRLRASDSFVDAIGHLARYHPGLVKSNRTSFLESAT